MSTINTTIKLYKINDWLIARLDDTASQQLPSRNIAMVKGTINAIDFQTVLEPDGNGSHWFNVDKAIQNKAGVKAGDTVRVVVEPTKDWTEPELPADVANAISGDPKASDTWAKATTMAHWEWMRWIRATNKSETRMRRIEVACSKLKSGMLRPCCFNTSACTEPSVSKNGVLLEPILNS